MTKDFKKYLFYFMKVERTGLGKLYMNDNLIYEGEWKNDKFEGSGILRAADSSFYNG